MADGKKAGMVVGIGAAIATLFVAMKAKAAPAIPAADIELYGLSIDPNVTYRNESVDISVFARNNGEIQGSYEVICNILISGEVMKNMKKTVTLQPGESKPVAFSWKPTDAVTQPTSYQVSVDGLTGSVIVYPTPQAAFQVSNLVIDPAEVYVGETVNIMVTVTNTGNAPGTREVQCIID